MSSTHSTIRKTVTYLFVGFIVLALSTVTTTAYAVKYGGASAATPRGECPRDGGAGHSIDKHSIQFVQPSAETMNLIKQLQESIDKAWVKGLRFATPTPDGARDADLTKMLGAAKVTIGSAVYYFATISGDDWSADNAMLAERHKLMSAITTKTGKLAANNKVTFVYSPRTVRADVFFRNKHLLLKDSGLSATFRPTIAATVHNRTAKCAARKLFREILRLAATKIKKASDTLQIEMTEMAWYAPEHPGHVHYSASVPVESCDACKIILPQLLCDAP